MKNIRLLLDLVKIFILFIIGGYIYYNIEIRWRGFSHMSMFVVGGFCFILIDLINEFFSFEMPMISQMFVSSILVTFIELLAGLILNVWLDLGVWDYSQVPYNFMGQICLLYFNFWFVLSAVAIVIADYIRYFLFGEEKPRYVIFFRRNLQ